MATFPSTDSNRAASSRAPSSEPSIAAAGPELSIIDPAFNEGDNVAELVSRLDAALRGSSLGEGMLSSPAPYLAVMDGDLQHDETALPPMLSNTSFTRKRGATFQFSDKERKRLKTVSNLKAQTRASADPDNPPISEQQLNRMALAREVRLIREKTGLSQPQFAARFHGGSSFTSMQDCCNGRDANTATFVAMCVAAVAGESGRCDVTLACSLIGLPLRRSRYERWEPYDGRPSRTVLRGAPAEMPGPTHLPAVTVRVRIR